MARTTGTTTLAELVRRGKLEDGERLVIFRRSAPPIEGVLQADGSIRVGQTVSATPSQAARLALSIRASNGWLRWRVPRLSNKALAQIREELS
jgi:hypothetical protein